MGKKGRLGASSSSAKLSKERARRRAAARRRQDRAWAAKSGPVYIVKPGDATEPAPEDPPRRVKKQTWSEAQEVAAQRAFERNKAQVDSGETYRSQRGSEYRRKSKREDY